MERLVVIGGVAAGTSGAAKARRTDPGMEVVLYTREEDISYGACGLPYMIGGEVSGEEKLVARRVSDFTAQGIRVLVRHQVERILPAKRKILVADLDRGREEEVGYDKLIIATGARSKVPLLEGIRREGVFTLRTLREGVAVNRYLEERRPQRAVIIGAGFIAMEMAEAFARRGLGVSLLARGPQILSPMDPDMGNILREYLVSKGVEVRTEERVKALEGEGQGGPVRRVVTEKGVVPADLVLVAVGIQPNSELAAEAGIELGTAGAIRVNQRMETSLPGIYAAGDCAVTTQLVTGEEVYHPLGTTANKQGRTAGENAAGGHARFRGVVGTGIARVFDLELARTGLSERDCRARNMDYEVRRVKSRTVAGYSPGGGEVHLKVVAERPGNRLLGAQIIGAPGAAKRIDVFATALTLGATVQQLQNMDLAYAPPFSPVYDPVLIALNQF